MAIVLFSCLSLFLAMSGNAFAYTTEGGRWNNTPTSGCCAQIGLQFNHFTMGYDHDGVTNGAIAWDDSPANVTFNFGSGALTAQDTTNCGAGWDGQTQYSINIFGYFQYANVYLNYCLTQNESAYQIQSVAAHELGHAIGLDHAPGCVIMEDGGYCTDVPAQDDVNGVNALY